MITHKSIDDIISKFDFQKCRRVMSVLGLCWAGSDDAPTLGEMKRCVRDLFNHFPDWNLKVNQSISTGGFILSKDYDGDGLTLRFILEEYSVWEDEDADSGT